MTNLQIRKFFIFMSILLIGTLVAIPSIRVDSAPHFAISFVVNSNNDLSDSNLGDGLCNTANSDCTLRAALEEANTSQAGYDITFASNMTISPTDPLPALEQDNITISGVGRTIILDGSQVMSLQSGIWILDSSNCVVQGLTIRNWTLYGITIEGINNLALNNIIGTDGDGMNDANEKVILENNASGGISIIGTNANFNVIAGNEIGTQARPNLNGVQIIEAHNNLIGTNGDGVSDAIERNLIRSNTSYGIHINNSEHTIIAGNYIGLEGNGFTPAGNGTGIYIDGISRFNLIGTDGDGIGDVEERNVISASLNGPGVFLWGTYSNTIAGNYIGTDANGTTARGNSGAGIYLGNAHGNTIGTNGDGVWDDHEGNLISGNGQGGILLDGVERNIIAGNLIGTSATGTTAIGNQGSGIRLYNDAAANMIGTDGNGTSDPIEGNLISGNSGNGIYISGSNNRVAGNSIGTDVTRSSDIGNSSAGISLLSFAGAVASENLIGGSGEPFANLIAFNGGSGINVDNVSGDASVDNAFLGNMIFSNDGLGIDLRKHSEGGFDVPSPNDSQDRDSGANDMMNYPEFISAFTYPATGKTYTRVQITDGLKFQNFVVQVFANTTCDPSGQGEGQRYVGQTVLSTDGSGNAVSGLLELLVEVPQGEFLTATATLFNNKTRATSEFSPCRIVTRDIVMLPVCTLKGAFFDFREQPMFSSLRLGLAIGVPAIIGLGLGMLIGKQRSLTNLSRLRMLGGVGGGFVGLAFLGILSLAPSCGVPPVFDLPEPSLVIGSPPPTQEEPNLTPTSTFTAEPIASDTPTPTATTAQECTYTAVVNLFCRIGPGSEYKEIDTFTSGQSAPIMGRSVDTYYWYVIGPNNGQLCTVPDGAQYGNVTGDCGAIHSFTPIPLPTATSTPTNTPTCTPGVVGC